MAQLLTEDLSNDAAEVFKAAADSFRQELSDSVEVDFPVYKDSQSMISAIREIAKQHPIHRSRMTVACGKLQRFASKLEPYFDIVNIFMRATPGYASLVWGSVRLIFQLSSNHITFLEKVCDMFETLGSTLLVYEDFVQTLQTRARCQGKSYPRLLKSLSYVYLDIIRFCHHICTFFSQKRKGLKAKVNFIRQLIWQPFDHQFEALLRRLEEHKTLFHYEVSVVTTEEAINFYTKYEANMREAEKQTGSDHHYTALENKSLDERADELRTWINPPCWMNEFEQAQNHRTPGTADYILDNEIYLDWQSRVDDSAANFRSRTLSIRAKPGYGKTVLCGAIIDDLVQEEYDVYSPNVDRSPRSTVGFYFFDRRRVVSNGPADAGRALLTQLIHLHRHNKEVVDIASIVLAKNATGQSTATENETFEVLSMLLKRLDRVFLVLDGLDECSDYQRFLKRLSDAASESTSCGTLLLSRPTVQLPLQLEKECMQINLTRLENVGDIISFLRPKVEEMVGMGLLPDDFPADEIVHKISQRANGMFLWVRLLIDFLQLPVLTLQERVDAIENLNRLDGLDSIYCAILDSVALQFPGRSRKKVERMFHWVAFALRPLHIQELQTAISIPFDRAQTSRDVIPNFGKSLGLLSGSLIELTPSKTAQFIHSSAQEFFIGICEDSGSGSNPHAESYQACANRSIATACLSYLCYNVPARPLGDSSQVTPGASAIAHRFPLLKYSAQFWSDHLVNSLQEAGVRQDKAHADGSWEHLVSLAAKFLYDPQKVTLWIEAAWLFDSPRIQLPSQDWIISSDLSNISDRSLSQLSTLFTDLELLSQDLTVLEKSWGFLLGSEPNEIWDHSISSFTKSRFWETTKRARLIRLAPLNPDLKNYIMVQSQVSSTGNEIGIVKLIPPDSWLDPPLDPLDEWKACYEIWSVTSGTNLCSTEICLPPSTISVFLTDQASDLDKGAEDAQPGLQLGVPDIDAEPERPERPEGAENVKDRVSLPVGISSDLRRAMILDVVIEISLSDESSADESSKEGPSLISQTIDLRSDLADGYSEFYYIKFSPSAEFLVIVRESRERQRKESQTYGVRWLMQVFRHDNSSQPQVLNYRSYASMTCWAVPEISILSPCRGVAFHPTEPRLAFPQVCDGLPQTYIWNMDAPITQLGDIAPYNNPFPVHDPPIVDPSFSDEGRYLYGTDAPLEFGPFGNSVCNGSVPLITEVPMSVPVKMLDNTTPSRIQTNPYQTEEVAVRGAFELSKRPKPPVQKANSLVFDQDEGGVVFVSHLQQLEQNGTVIVRTFGTDGRLQFDTLSRLPKELKDCVDVSLSTHSLTEGRVRILLNKALQTHYAPSDVGDNGLPAIIERDKESIPSFVSTVPMPVGALRSVTDGDKMDKCD